MADQVVVIGGGAGGLMAAITLARAGHRVVLVEKNKELGRKILTTGNGRCNITNANLDISRYHGSNPQWAYHALTYYNQYALLAFFEDLGIPFVEESDGRYFTVSGQASAVVSVLQEEVYRLGVEVRLDEPVIGIQKKNQQFIVQLQYNQVITADRVVIAVGGSSYPRLGSSGDGFQWAASLGHRIIPTTPSLVPIRIAEHWIRALEGLRWDLRLQLIRDDQVLSESFGEVLFRSFGISGPAALAISREAGRAPEGLDTTIRMNFFSSYSEEELFSLLETRWQHRPDRRLGFSFVGLLPDRFAPAILTEYGFDPERVIAQIGKKERRLIAECFQNVKLTLDGVRSYSESQVTAGGVDTSEVNPKTMESRLVPGLYFVGEVLDIDGDSGGFNLQFAFSTAAMLE